jgi:signal peptidase I
MAAIGRVLSALFRLASLLTVIALFFKLLFVDIVVVPHNGMAPTLLSGERVLIWRNASADMGDVMVCQHPAQASASVLGRVIAFAGHTVSADYLGNLLVDDDRASVEWDDTVRFYDATREKLFTMRRGSIDYNRQNRHAFMIEQGQTFQLRTYQVNRGVYLLGDNRSDPSDDSREFGEVDPTTCRGQVFMRLTPADRTGPEDDIHHSYLDVIK